MMEKRSTAFAVRDAGTVTPGYGFDVTGLTYPDRLIVAVRKTFESAPELRLIDFRGAIIDRVTPGFASLGRLIWSRWVPSRQKLLVAYERALSSFELDIVTMDVTPSGFGSHVDTVFSQLQTADGVFDISPDGERLVHSPGAVETLVSAIDTRPTQEGRLASVKCLRR